MSIVSNKKIAIADGFRVSIRPMPKVSLADLISRRVDPSVPKASRKTYEELADQSGGRISGSHINDLKNGNRRPERLTVEKVVGLAKALGEHPTVVFEAAAGELTPGIKDQTVAQLLADFCELTQKERNDNVEFAIRLLRERVEEVKSKRQPPTLK